MNERSDTPIEAWGTDTPISMPVPPNPGFIARGEPIAGAFVFLDALHPMLTPSDMEDYIIPPFAPPSHTTMDALHG